MSIKTAALIRRLQEKGYKQSQIRKETGLSKNQIAAALRQEKLDSCGEVERIGRLLLRRVPSWWTGDNEEFRNIVRANFADVLGDA